MKKFGAQNMVTKMKKVLMKKPQKLMSKANLDKWNYGKPLSQKKIDSNYEQFRKIIIKENIEINELDIENEKNELYDSIFTHDPSLVLNDGALILNMGKKLRKDEIDIHEKFYQSKDIPIIGKITGKGTVEGGDCLWLNENLLLVGESYRTNKIGIIKLKNILNYHGIKVITTKLPEYKKTNSCFHLMSIISLLDEDLAIGCLSLISNEIKNILKKNNIKLIGISEKEYFKSKTLAVNILALSPRNLIIMSGYPETEEILNNENNKINLFEGKELCIKAEGGPTCLTRAILRE